MRLPISLSVSSANGRRSRRALRRQREQLPAPTRHDRSLLPRVPLRVAASALEAMALPEVTTTPLATAVDALP
ncbi:MAG TPA: hypothetical protein VMU89_05080 [Thermomicrobiaceae bacterium]|nr:hypothetical protein [Thermomicrobiaceae bacterium]